MNSTSIADAAKSLIDKDFGAANLLALKSAADEGRAHVVLREVVAHELSRSTAQNTAHLATMQHLESLAENNELLACKYMASFINQLNAPDDHESYNGVLLWIDRNRGSRELIEYVELNRKNIDNVLRFADDVLNVLNLPQP